MLWRLSFLPSQSRWFFYATRSFTSATNNSGCGASSDSTLSSNEPLRTRPEFPGKVRMGFLPEEWFQAFYNKTGVTGPYMLGVGLLTYLCSKEIYVMEHEYYSGLSMAILSVLAVKKLGPPIAKWLDKEVDKVEGEWMQQREAELKHIQDAIEAERKEQWRADGAMLLMDVKKEDIDLQIEATNREAAMQVYQDVKRRLDHEVAKNYVYARMNQKNMVQWIVCNVMKELPETGDMEKAMADLSALAVRAKVT